MNRKVRKERNTEREREKENTRKEKKICTQITNHIYTENGSIRINQTALRHKCRDHLKFETMKCKQHTRYHRTLWHSRYARIVWLPLKLVYVLARKNDEVKCLNIIHF